MREVSPAAALEAMTELLPRLRALLEQFDRPMLATRPPSGDWSAIENARHAFYAEQHHLGLYIPGGLGLSRLGLPQGQHAAITSVTDERTDPGAVFDEWQRVRAAVRARLDLTLPGLEIQLPRMMRHQVAHGRLAARALSQITGQTVRVPRSL